MSGLYSMVLILAAWSMLGLGFLLGLERPQEDPEAERAAWHRHVQQALFVARR